MIIDQKRSKDLRWLSGAIFISDDLVSGVWLYFGLSARAETENICWAFAPISKQMIITDVVDLGARARSIRERMWIMDFWFLRKLDPVLRDSSGLDQTKWNEEISFHFGQIWFLLASLFQLGFSFDFFLGKLYLIVSGKAVLLGWLKCHFPSAPSNASYLRGEQHKME